MSNRIEAALNAGANRVDSLSFTVSEERLDDTRADLTQEAVDNAGDKADALARAMDVEVMGVKTASLVDLSDPPVRPLPCPLR